MNSIIKSLIDRSGNCLVELSYYSTTGSSFEEMDGVILKYFAICSEIETFSRENLAALIQEVHSYESQGSRQVLDLLSRNPTDEIVTTLVAFVNTDDIMFSHSAGVTLIGLKSAPTNNALLFSGINKTKSFGQSFLKIAFVKWSNEKDFSRIVQLINNEPYDYNKCILLEALIVKRSELYAPIYESFLNYKNEEVRLTALAGLILLGRTNLSGELMDLAKSKKTSTKKIAYMWMGRIMLPEFVPLLLQGQAEKSSEFKYFNLGDIGNIGINRSIEVLLEVIKSKDRKLAEPALFSLNQITGMQASSIKFDPIERECLPILASRNPNDRYYGKHKMTPEVLVNALHHNGQTFWQLFSMTGEHFNFDVNLDKINNWESIRKWREWSTENSHKFEAGAFYFLGEKKDFSVS